MEGGGALVGGGSLVAPDGFAWIAVALGVGASDRDGLFPAGSGFVRGELVEVASLEAFVAKRRRVLNAEPEELEERGEVDADVGRAAGPRRRLRGGAAEGTAEAEEPAAGGGDLATMAIDYDGQGERYKDWWTLCMELSSPTVQDWPSEGPRTVVHLCKHMGELGSLASGSGGVVRKESRNVI